MKPELCWTDSRTLKFIDMLRLVTGSSRDNKVESSTLYLYFQLCCGFEVERSTLLVICCRFNKVDRVEFNFVASVYQPGFTDVSSC